MNVLQRNFFRLLRSGTFGSKEQLEPLSTWKWDKLYRLSLMHGVAALIYDGMMVMKDDFFLQLSGFVQQRAAAVDFFGQFVLRRVGLRRRRGRKRRG